MFITPRLNHIGIYLSFIVQNIHIVIYFTSKICCKHFFYFFKMLLATIVCKHPEQMLLYWVEYCCFHRLFLMLVVAKVWFND